MNYEIKEAKESLEKAFNVLAEITGPSEPILELAFWLGRCEGFLMVIEGDIKAKERKDDQ